LIDELPDALRARPDQPAILTTRRGRPASAVTAGQLIEWADAYAGGLHHGGLTEGDTVGFAVRPGPRAVALMLAAARLRLRIAVLDPNAGADVIASRLAAAAPRMVVADAAAQAVAGWARPLARRANLALPDLAGMACGRIAARADEHGPLGRAFFRVLVGIAAAFGRIRPANRAGGQYLAPYRMHAGNNMAIRADLYLRVGGMPRRPSPTDRTFLNRVRRQTANIVHCGEMVVENSTRRISCYGVLGTARWYLDRGSGDLTPDPR
jgi:acyl-CoA synthetase (AMP-forming)/AMP-acid ligase II